MAPQRALYAASLQARTARIKELDVGGFTRKEISTEVGCSVETVRRSLLGLMKRY